MARVNCETIYKEKYMPVVKENYDVCIVGAGHAGCEAALACARLGLETILFTISIESVAMMPCNPNIGGSSKGHLVREIDALGGEMGVNIDHTFIQSKMLNKSKGPAVHSLRAQADKADYSARMRQVLQNTDHLTLRQAEVTELMVEDKQIRGVKTFSGAEYYAKAVVLCTGTYLKARCLYGDVVNHTGPNGLQAAASKQVHQLVSTDVPLIFPKCRSSSVMRVSYHSHLQPIRMMSRLIR